MGRIAALVSTLLVLSAAQAAEHRSTVVAEGHAAVVGANRPLARAQAIAVALRAAVAQAAAGLGAPADGEDGATDRAVYDRAAAFVPRSTVVTEDVDGHIYTVQISADVDVEALRLALRASRRQAAANSRPLAAAKTARGRVLVLATEQLGPRRVFGWTDLVWTPGMIRTKTTVVREVNELGGIEATMSDVFGGAGFDVIDPQVLRGKLAPRPAFEVLDLSANEARAIARKSDADYVVIAKGEAQLAAQRDLAGAGMRSGQGNVVARLVRVRDGHVVASATEHTAAVHIDPETARLQAIDGAARRAAEALVRKLDD